MSRATFWRFWR